MLLCGGGYWKLRCDIPRGVFLLSILIPKFDVSGRSFTMRKDLERKNY